MSQFILTDGAHVMELGVNGYSKLLTGPTTINRWKEKGVDKDRETGACVQRGQSEREMGACRGRGMCAVMHIRNTPCMSLHTTMFLM